MVNVEYASKFLENTFRHFFHLRNNFSRLEQEASILALILNIKVEIVDDQRLQNAEECFNSENFYVA